MKNAKLISIVSVVIAIVLLAAGLFVGFDRGADVGGAYVLTVQINENFENSDIEAIMKEAGATGCYVQVQQTAVATGFKSNQVAVISFEVERDADITAIHQKAEQLLSEKYFLKFPGELTHVASTFNEEMAISMWPALIVLVVMLAYVFVRFGSKMGVAAIASMLVTGAATTGIIGLCGLKVTAYTIPALMVALALSYAFTVVFGLVNKDNAKKLEDAVKAQAVTTKQVTALAAITLALTAVALVIVLILGEAMLKNFALTALIGVVFSTFASVFVMPELVRK